MNSIPKNLDFPGKIDFDGIVKHLENPGIILTPVNGIFTKEYPGINTLVFYHVFSIVKYLYFYLVFPL